MTNQTVDGVPRGQAIQVWHQDSPGMRVWVVRGFWGRLIKGKEFASVGEKTYPTKPWGYP